MSLLTERRIAKTFKDILKFNPYHGQDGRFSSANGANSMTVRTSSAAGQKAIENIRAREKANGGGSTGGSSAPSKPKELTTDKEYDEYASHYKGWEKSLSKAEKNVVGKYQSESFAFNQKLRHPYEEYDNEWGSQATDKEYKALDSALAKSTVHQDTTVYRAISDPDALGDLNSLVGKTITDKGYASTSLSKKAAEDYGDGIICKINVPKGSHAAYISGVKDKEGQDFTGNRELLLPRDAKYKITKVTPKEVEYKTQWGTFKQTQWEVEMEYES
jgi:hypothetical protein